MATMMNQILHSSSQLSTSCKLKQQQMCDTAISQHYLHVNPYLFVTTELIL